RFSRDWSSDVCSSDLLTARGQPDEVGLRLTGNRREMPGRQKLAVGESLEHFDPAIELDCGKGGIAGTVRQVAGQRVLDFGSFIQIGRASCRERLRIGG